MVQTSAEVYSSMTTCTFRPENVWHLHVTY